MNRKVKSFTERVLFIRRVCNVKNYNECSKCSLSAMT